MTHKLSFAWPQGVACQENVNIGVWTNDRSCSFTLKIVVCVWYSVPSRLIWCCPTLSRPVLPPPVLKQRRHRVLQGPGVAVCGFSVSLCTVGGQRQYWGGRHGAGSTGYSYRPASVCAKSSLHTHNRHCVQFLPTPSFVLSGSLSLPPIPSTSSPPFFFCLEQVGLHWSRHLGCRWEAQISEGLRTDLGIRDCSPNLQDTKRWRLEWTWKKLSRVALQNGTTKGNKERTRNVTERILFYL